MQRGVSLSSATAASPLASSERSIGYSRAKKVYKNRRSRNYHNQ